MLLLTPPLPPGHGDCGNTDIGSLGAELMTRRDIGTTGLALTVTGGHWATTSSPKSEPLPSFVVPSQPFQKYHSLGIIPSYLMPSHLGPLSSWEYMHDYYLDLTKKVSHLDKDTQGWVGNQTQIYLIARSMFLIFTHSLHSQTWTSLWLTEAILSSRSALSDPIWTKDGKKTSSPC